MSLTIQRFRFYTTTDPTATADPDSVDLVVLPVDRMRAERLSTTELPPSQRGPGARKANAETYMMLWAWCAATRLGHTADDFQTWAGTVLDYDRLDAEGQPVDDDVPTEDVEDELVDPTRTGARTS